MGTLLFGQKYSWPSATIAQAWNQEQPLQYHHPVRVQNGRQQFCVITIMALHGETMSPMPLCWNRLAPWPCISFSVSITKICNFWQLLAVMKPITLHPDLRWSHQFFALSPYTFTIAQNCPTPPPLPSPTTTEIHQPILTKDPIYIQPHSKWVEVHWSLIRLEQYFHFPLFYAQKRRKKNSYKNSCHSCVHATTEAVLNTEPR